MLNDLSIELNDFINHAKLYLIPWLFCLGILWLINILNWITGSRLNILGIYPRNLFGLVGIPFSPLLHGNFSHLFFNSIPLFALGLILLARGPDVFFQVTMAVTLLGGLGVWLFGRKSLHIGASGVISGYFGFLLATAYFNPSMISILLALLVIYYFGSIFFGIFPQEEKISWESHLLGFLSGIAYAFWWKNQSPNFLDKSFHYFNKFF